MPFDTATYPLIRGTTFKQNGQFRNKELLYEKYLKNKFDYFHPGYFYVM